MKSLYELKSMLCDELDKLAGQGELSAGSLETLHKLTDTIKNIDKIEMLEDEGYSESGGMSRGAYGRGGSYGGGSGYDGGGSYARGGYARAGGHRSSYESGDSYANRGKHYVRAHYSRDDGRRYMLDQLEEMMQSAGGEKEREAIRRCISQLENA